MGIIGSVLHPTDLSKASLPAFAHALKVALDGQATFRLLHIETPRHPVPWSAFPGIRKTLIRWGKLPEGASKKDVLDLGLEPVKWRLQANNPTKGILKDVEKHHPDLIVMATHTREGIFDSSVAQPVARKSPEPDLLLPSGCEGFISVETGEVSLRKVLLPVTRDLSHAPGLRVLENLAETLGVKELEVGLLHVGAPDERPIVNLPSAWKGVELEGEGAVADTIRRTAVSWEADLTVMITRGYDSLKDYMVGSTAEQVINYSKTPVLNVSAE